MEGKIVMKEFIDIESLEFVAECRETEERVAFTMGDLYGWDDETVFLDTGIYLNKPRKGNWAIVCKSSLGRRLNPAYNIHIRTDEDKLIKEPLKLLSIKKYSKYRFEAEFNNHVIRTGSFLRRELQLEELRKELPYYEEELGVPIDEEAFERAEMNPRGIRTKNFISAIEIWKAASEYVHYGCSSEEFLISKFVKVKNHTFGWKPSGGFWASPTSHGKMGELFDWKAFCEKEEYYPKGKPLNKKFYFCLDINAHVVRIESMDTYQALPKVVREDCATGRKEEFIDFEKCMRQGIDAIEYAYSAIIKDENMKEEMDRKMLGWDCDSILIMNPKIILKESFMEEMQGGFLIKG